MRAVRAVVFDWRGTLVTTLDDRQWVRAALCSLGRNDDVDAISRAIAVAAGRPSRLEASGVDADTTLHRETYYRVFADAGLDAELADALYAVESDPRHNRFAVDVAETFDALDRAGCVLAILSDIHFDIRPVFAAADLAGFIDVFVLSYEYGTQKPDPAIFRAALDELRTDAAETLMVGDRATHDGAAVELGMPTLLVSPLTDPGQRRLHHVTALAVQRNEKPPAL